jgi:hypothetical protein
MLDGQPAAPVIFATNRSAFEARLAVRQCRSGVCQNRLKLRIARERSDTQKMAASDSFDWRQREVKVVPFSFRRVAAIYTRRIAVLLSPKRKTDN